ncbi:MAG: hypothetical protein D3911_04025 [Candidatus Electrothrix sp. AW3_4]|nr:hypothetical protein [Candidatus Electrothrix gigas]
MKKINYLFFHLAVIIVVTLFSQSAFAGNVNCGPNIELRPGSNNLNFQKGQSWNTCSGYRFVFQNDANLVLYRPDGYPVWATGTNGTGADNFAVQSDGNVVLYDHGRPVWATNTNGRGRFFAIQTDGNLVVYTSSGRPVWASNTHSGRSGSRNASGDWRR